MVKCDLAPEAGLKSFTNRTWGGKSAFAALWRAESFMEKRGIKSDSDRIQWFLRGAPDHVICWYVQAKQYMNPRWIVFKVYYVSNKGTMQDKRLLFDSLVRENWMTAKTFITLLSLLVPRDSHLTIRKIISKFSPEITDKFRRWMHRRPSHVGRLEWLCIAADRFTSNWEFVSQPKSHPPSDNAREAISPSNQLTSTIKDIKRNPLSISSSGPARHAPENQPPADKLIINTPTVRTACDQQRTLSLLTDTIKNGVEANHTPKHPKKEQLAQPSQVGDISAPLYQLDDLKHHYPTVMDNEIKPRPPCPIAECVIDTPADQQVQVPWQGRIPQAHLEATRTAIGKLETSKVIRKSDSLWRNPIRPVIKPDGSVRICTNLIMLNTLVKPDPYTIPLMTDIIERVQGAQFFTLIDLKDGYFQIAIREEDRHKTAFKFEHQLYEWCRMPMGYKNAPALFQRIMDIVLREHLNNGVSVYLDDIVIYGKTKEEHDRIVHFVFQQLKRYNLIVNEKKVQFCVAKIKLLGFMVDGTRMAILPEIKEEIDKFPNPNSTPALRRFLGKMNVYHKFIPNFASIAVPLYEKTGPHTKFLWTPAMDAASTELKTRLARAIALYHPDYNKTFILETDASDTGIGAVLLQYNNDNQLVPIRWISRKLSSAERNYGITEKELLAVVWAIKHLDYVLRGRRFSIVTDHKALMVIQTKDDFGNPRMNRWISSIQEYDFSISYRKGEEMHSADALSRIYEKNNHIVPELASDETVLDVKQNPPPLKMPEEDAEDRRAIIKKAHEKLLHRGVDAVIYELRNTISRPGTRQIVNDVLKECEICNKNNRKHGGGAQFIPTQFRLEKTAIDIMKVDGSRPYILVFIDFFTRTLRLHSLRVRTSAEIISVLDTWWKELGVPKEINTDNAMEFTSQQFSQYCASKQIQHHRTSIEKHEANGRVERAIRTVRDGLVKTKGNGTLQIRLKKIQDAYNTALHNALGMSPNEAWEDNNDLVSRANAQNSSYAKRFKRLKREKFALGQQVRISKKENLKDLGKKQDRFQDTGKIVDICGQDSYIVEDSSGRIVKRSHAHLKSMEKVIY